MGGRNPSQMAAIEFPHDLCGLSIRKMAERAADTRFQEGWVRARVQHALIVIALEQQRVYSAKCTDDDVTAFARIRQQSNAAIAVAENELQRLGCVVGHRIRVDRQRSELGA